MFYDMDSHHSVFLQEKFFIPLTCGKVKRKNSPITIAGYFFLTFLLEEERLTLEREELELREDRLTVDREGLELRDDRLTLERVGLELRDDRLTVDLEELELRLGVETLLLGVDRELTELLGGVREVVRLTVLDDDGRRTAGLEDRELREGAVVTRPLEEADEEEVEENFLTNFFAVLVRDEVGVWEREEEKRFTTLFVFVFDVLTGLLLFVEDEGNLLVTVARLGVVLFTLWEEDLNLEVTTLFPCVAELLDATDFCELGENLLMAREEIPAFEELSPVLLTRLNGLFITPEF